MRVALMFGILFATLAPAQAWADVKNAERCAQIQIELANERTNSVEAFAQLRRLSEIFGEDARPIFERLLGRAEGENTPDEHALSVVAAAYAQACERSAANTQNIHAELDAILSDPRFKGVADGESWVDEYLEKLGIWLREYFETDQARSFAGISRDLFLMAFALFSVWLIWRVFDARARGKKATTQQSQQKRTKENQRREAFAERWALAEIALEKNEFRKAMWDAQMALLIRLGEVNPGRISPDKTLREIQRGLASDRKILVQDCFSFFEQKYLGGKTGVSEAQDFLRMVKSSAERMNR